MPKQHTEHKDAIQNAQAEAGDDFDKDLERSNHRASGGSALGNLPDAVRNDTAAESSTVTSSDAGTDQGEFPQHSRKGQAQSPVEETPNQPEPQREGHKGGARDS